MKIRALSVTTLLWSSLAWVAAAQPAPTTPEVTPAPAPQPTTDTASQTPAQPSPSAPAEAPPAAPPPAPGATDMQGPAAGAPLAPAAAPPPPPPFVQWGAVPGSDQAQVAEAPSSEKPLRWRGSTFVWDQSASTTIFGVGSDYISSDTQQYTWDFTLKPNFYILDYPKDKLTAFGDEIGFNEELTNSDVTTEKNELLFKDMQLGLKYTRDIWKSEGTEAGEWLTSGSLTARYTLPTSEKSSSQGRYGVFSIGPSVKQQIKLLGTSAQGLNNFTVGLGLTYSHLFSRSYNPTNEDIDVARQNNTGRSIDSDQLTMSSMDIDRLVTTLTFDLPIFQDLTFSSLFRIIGNYRHDWEDTGCDVELATGCVNADRDETRVTYVPDTIVDLSLDYPVYEVVNLTLGYSNWTRAIGEDGERRNIFYSPDAQFYFDITANLDIIYTKVTKRDHGATASNSPTHY